MLAEALGGAPLPAPVLRAVIGGLHGGLCGELRSPSSSRGSTLAEEMLGWTLSVRSAAFAGIAADLAARSRDRVRAMSLELRRTGEPTPGETDTRARLLRSALRLAATLDHAEISPARIADGADVPIEAFMDLYDGREDCLLAALDDVATALLGIVCEPVPSGESWPCALRRSVTALLEHLARNPLHARAITHVAYVAGPRAIERNLQLASTLAETLTAGAPGGPPGAFARDAAAGAIWHTVLWQVAGDRIGLLAALPDYLSYVLLAPFLGSPAAAEAVAGASGAGARPSRRSG